MLEFRQALVTGASSGIGEGLCRLLASKGISLIITGRDQQRLTALQEELEKLVDVIVLCLDLGDKEQRQSLVRALWDKTPDLVVNNAGLGLYGDAISLDTAGQLEILNINGMALLELTLEAAKALKSKRRKGVIVNVSSVVGCFPCYPSFSVYAASKAFVNSFSQGINAELASSGIRVLAACPGRVSTRFQQRAGLKDPAKQIGRRDPTQMNSDFAAKQIWKQIERNQPVYVFNRFYRYAAFAVRYLLPIRWSQYLLRKFIPKT